MRVHWHWTQRPGLLSLMRNSIDKPAGDFAVDPGVCIEARERAGLEWLLRFCARAPRPVWHCRRGTRCHSWR
jgi:hypothetical protein